MKIRQTPGMTVKLPDGVTGETQKASTGEPWFVITELTVDRGKSLAIRFGGFPGSTVDDRSSLTIAVENLRIPCSSKSMTVWYSSTSRIVPVPYCG
jgi:hypothetical protein